MPLRKNGKRSRSHGNRPHPWWATPVPPTTHSIALVTSRDATVVFGAEYGVLLAPIKRRIAQYLRQERLFVVGGRIIGMGVLRSCYSLDAIAGVWVQEASMTEGRAAFGLCVLRGDLWAVGGQQTNRRALRSCERLDVATHTWIRGPDMATERWRVGVGVLNGEIWATGGRNSTNHNYSLPLSSCERLDAMTSTWVDGPQMTISRAGHCVVVLRGELWAIDNMGLDDEDGSTERLDAATNRWVSGPRTPLTRRYFAIAVFREQLWAVGGIIDDEIVSSCEYLDAASNTWIEGPSMNIPRHFHSLAVLEGELWAVGGSDELSVQSCERLNAISNMWVTGPALSITHRGALAAC